MNCRNWSIECRGSLLILVIELASIARRLVPEHGRSTYGEPSMGLTPWDIYTQGDAENALGMAKRAIEIMKTILRTLGINVA